MSSNRSKSFIEPFTGSSVYNAGVEHENNIIGQRIMVARKKAGLSRPAFSELLSKFGLSIKGNGILRWENGTVIPNAYQLVAVCHALHIEDGISYFTGAPSKVNEINDALELDQAGLKKLEDYKADLSASGRYRRKKVERIKERYIEMPVSTLPVSAGTGEFLEEGNFDLIRYPASQVPERAEFGIRVTGDSMEPVYHDQQIVWVQTCHSLRVGEVGIFVYDGEGYMKEYGEQEADEEFRMMFSDDNGNVPMQPVLISFNEAYAPRIVNPHGGFKIIGRVLN